MYCLTIESVVVVATMIYIRAMVVSSHHVIILATLLGLGVLQAELGRTVERVRRRVNGTPHINMTSVWTFAGVLLLPPPLVGALVASLYLHLAVRSWYRLRRVPAYRTVFNGALAILTCYVAHGALAIMQIPTIDAAIDAEWAGVGAVGVGILIYFVTGAIVVVPGLRTRSRTLRALFGGWGENGLELATLCLGALLGLALTTMTLAAGLLIIPPMLMLHRQVLIRQLEAAAARDDKTGLWNTRGWHSIAAGVLTKAERSTRSTFCLLMIDIDFFKKINDTYGHLIGDLVLKAVANQLSDSVRDYDAVARFGGEEFVVLLPDVDEIDGLAVAERIRTRVEQMTVPIYEDGSDVIVTTIDKLSVSIGVAVYPTAGNAIQPVLQAADRALLDAKQAGRNRVVVAA
ncbi:GGDEF domain-containing protein [Kibdelosporangium phytohabitans]|uniref:GGDEF domain-containing protein n=1 Tax=Kibdelosporangium phytohabitans TaxID=860235 RepID=UPI002FF86933